jgi:hypothetical protein
MTRQSGAVKVEVNAPVALAEYNECMGGCDTADQKRANYRIQRKRITRWYMTLFYWALDVNVINSYVIFSSEALEIISHKNYRLALADALMRRGARPRWPRLRIPSPAPSASRWVCRCHHSDWLVAFTPPKLSRKACAASNARDVPR